MTLKRDVKLHPRIRWIVVFLVLLVGDPLLGGRVPICQYSVLDSCLGALPQVWAHHHSPVVDRTNNLPSIDVLSD